MSYSHSPTQLTRYYKERLAEFGDTAKGAGWPNEADRLKRFGVMSSIAAQPIGEASLLDVACGTGAYLSYLKSISNQPQRYVGIDTCQDAIKCAQIKHPDAKLFCCDLLQEDGQWLASQFDYTIINGLFTVKADVEDAMMWSFLTQILQKVWPHTGIGLAFNVMSDVVDWRRNDLFHVPMDRLAQLLFSIMGRRVIFRNDYDLYEYTVYAYRHPFGAMRS